MKNNYCSFINYVLVNYYMAGDVFIWTFKTHIQFILQHIRLIFIWAFELKVTFLEGLQWNVARMGLLASLCLLAVRIGHFENCWMDFHEILFFPEKGCNMFLRNFSSVVQAYTASYSWQWGGLLQFCIPSLLKIAKKKIGCTCFPECI